MRDVRRVDAARRRDLDAEAAHRDGDVRRLQHRDPAGRQPPVGVCAVDRVVQRPPRPRHVEVLLDRWVCEEAHPPDVRERDQEVRLDPVEIAEQRVGAEGVAVHRVDGNPVPPRRGPARLPPDDLDAVPAVCEPFCDSAGDGAEPGRRRRAVRHPQDLHRSSRACERSPESKPQRAPQRVGGMGERTAPRVAAECDLIASSRRCQTRVPTPRSPLSAGGATPSPRSTGTADAAYSSTRNGAAYGIGVSARAAARSARSPPASMPTWIPSSCR